MGIGTYRHRVTLEHPAVMLEPPDWYCSIQSAASQVVDGLTAYFLRGRYHPGITLETRVIFEGRTVQIQGITDVDERHLELVLLCVEVVARGRTPDDLPPVVGAPTITAPPVGASIGLGESVTLTVVASGTPPLTYQWLQAGVPIAGATNQFHVTGPVTATTVYAVIVTNAYGSVTSAPATVAIPLSYQSQVLADGAAAYWPLDEASGTTAHDMANAHDGTISGGVGLNQPGIGTSRCMVFAGTTGKIVVPALALVPPYTFECWMKTTETAAQNQLWSTLQEPTPEDGVMFQINAVHLRAFTELSGGGSINAQAFNPVPAVGNGAWHHVVVSFDPTTMIAYIDGVAQTLSNPLTGLVGSTAHVLEIGFDSKYGVPYIGALQDVAFYPRALTPAEISAHHTLGAAR